jgi:hypothetical protein
MVKILAFYDAPFGCSAADRQTDGQTDRIPKFNTSLKGRGKNKQISKNLRILHWNANSVNNKKEEFQILLNKLNPDIVSLNETKLEPRHPPRPDTTKFPTLMNLLHDYQFHGLYLKAELGFLNF